MNIKIDFITLKHISLGFPLPLYNFENLSNMYSVVDILVLVGIR